jgi:signal transduction histidine kinase/ligand-binding sensor domain-containing protein
MLLRALTCLCVLWFSAFAEHLPIRIYNAADGLGSSFVNFEMLDSRGFMWFCTRDGLSRFDGSRFINYKLIEHDSPPGIENMYEAHDGAYWITSTGGTFRFDPRSLSSPNETTPTLNAEHITDYRGTLFEDRFGNFWLGSAGLFRIVQRDGKTDVVPFDLDLPPKPNTAFSVADIGESSDGSVWIHTTWGLIRRLPDERLVFYPDPEVRELSTGSLRMIVAKNDEVWESDGNRLYIIKPDTIDSLAGAGRLTVKELAATEVVDLVQDGAVPKPINPGEIYQYRSPQFIDKFFGKQLYQTKDGAVWIAAEDNLLEFSAGSVHVHTTAEGLPSVMGPIGEDSVGNLWVTSQSGLARLDRNGLITFGTADGSYSNRFLAINEGPDGTMYFSNPDAHLSKFNGRSFETIRLSAEPNALHLWNSRTAFVDSDGNWWLLTGSKLYQFSGTSDFSDLSRNTPVATFTRDNGLKSNGVFQAYQDSSGSMWISTRGADASGHGVARMKKGENRFTAFSTGDGLPDGKSAAAYAEDKFGHIWMGFYEGGVARFDGTRFEFYGLANGFPSGGNITDLFIDGADRLWISTAADGLVRIDDLSAKSPTFTQFSTADGLNSNNTRTITEDHLGRIYVGTARGVDRISPDSGHVKHFSMADGLGADFVVDSHCDKKGDLWFATNSGVSRLTPLADESSFAPKIWLGGLRIAGELQATTEIGSNDIQIGDLSDRQNNLQVDFFGIDLRAGEVLKYQYKLEGADSDWSAPSESRTINFANLQPASYRLMVRAVNSDGMISESPATLSFKILPPIWKRWWFVSLIILAGVLIAIGMYRYRVTNLREINQALLTAKNAESALRLAREQRIAELENVRSRIATDLHDDIGSSLTQIAVLSEVAQAHAGKGNGGPPEALRKISDVSSELIGTMSDIVWAINPAKDHLSDLTQRMRRVASDLLSPKGILVQFHSREEDKKLVVKTNTRREVFLIFKESINNITKHADAKRVDIELEITDDLLRLRIQDDGKGFTIGPPSFEDTFSSEAPGGNGIRNMRKRAREMGGRFDIDSSTGKGTTILLTLPLDESTDITVEPNVLSA